jgi:hypothetical protein
MIGKQLPWRIALVVGLLFFAARPSEAGPYIGDFGWCWKPAPNCPKGRYCFLHYWTPTWYWVKYCLFPAYPEQYAPGVPVPVGNIEQPSRCRTLPPFPSLPYSNPAEFFGVQIVPDREEAQEKK